MNLYGECPNINVELIADQETEHTDIDLGVED